MQVRDVITAEPTVIEASSTVQAAARAMRLMQTSFLPVCSGGKLVGVITSGDLVRRGVVMGSYIFELKVQDLMTCHAIWCSPREDIVDVARLMQINGIRRLPVKDADNEVIGVISFGDIVALAPRLSPVELMATAPMPGKRTMSYN